MGIASIKGNQIYDYLWFLEEKVNKVFHDIRTHKIKIGKTSFFLDLDAQKSLKSFCNISNVELAS